jgi:hypothetical protein
MCAMNRGCAGVHGSKARSFEGEGLKGVEAFDKFGWRRVCFEDWVVGD